MYKLREVNQGDYEAISLLNNKEENVHLQKNGPGMDREFFDRMLLDESIKWYAVENSGQILAFALFQLDVSAKTLHIDKLTIDAAYMKKGLDEHLYSKIERLAERKDLTTMKAEISTSGSEIHDFFERKGWIKADNGSYVLSMKR